MTRTLRWAAVMLAAFLVLLALVASHWHPLLRLDLAVDTHLNRYYAHHRDPLAWWQRVSTVLQPTTFQTIAVLAGALLWLRGQPRRAAFTVVAVVGAGLLSTLVKVLVGRHRPELPVTLGHASGSSFPSGHAISAWVALAVLVILLRPLPRRWTLPVTLLAAVVALAVAASRLALGVHYPSDVLGSWLLGTAWMLVCAELLSPRAGRAAPDRPPAGSAGGSPRTSDAAA